MKLKRLLLITLSILLLFVSVMLVLPAPVFAGSGSTQNIVDQNPALPKTGARERTHPNLIDFRSTLTYGVEGKIVGIYAPGAFALPVVQQPSSNPGFVSSVPEVVTQFGLASEYGTIGFLAHNTLSGAQFFDLEIGQKVILVYGDGSVKTYIIHEQLRYQALTPNSPYSKFRDLDHAGIEISSTDLFNQVYAEEGQLVFQTCLASDGLENWGRYFVLAIPAGSSPRFGHRLTQLGTLSLH